MNILLCGHACGPGLGSEPGLTWNWAWYLSQKHRVWAVVHPEYRVQIEAFLATHPNDNLTFIWASLPRAIDPWDPAKGESGLRLHYLIWQRIVLGRATELLNRINFDVCHYVSWATVHSTPLLWKLPLPFFWGPIGGGQTAPLAFREYLGPNWWKEAARNLRVSMRALSPSLRQAIRNSALILVTNNDTRRLLEAAGAHSDDISLFLADGLSHDSLAAAPIEHDARSEIVLHWSGRLEVNKGLPLALEALAKTVDHTNLPIRMEISGDGPERAFYERLALKFAISDRVLFLGRISRSEVLLRLRDADGLLFTSLRDSFGSVCLEAMAQGLPVIVLNHQGVRDFIPEEASWKIELTSPSETLTRLASAIREMAINRNARVDRGRAALAFARSQLWPRRVERMEVLYEQYRHHANR